MTGDSNQLTKVGLTDEEILVNSLVSAGASDVSFEANTSLYAGELNFTLNNFKFCISSASYCDTESELNLDVTAESPHKIRPQAPKQKQRQLYFCSKAAVAIINGMDLSKETADQFKLQLPRLANKGGWVHYHTYSSWLNTLLLPKHKMIRDLHSRDVSNLRHRLNRIKVGRTDYE